ncbi:MAG: 3-oxoacyl-ACP reductase FabG [Clostridia bacterium]|nr:3-oxoacyl-ACP reductase FabG [Clostridia bacterium]
MKSNKVVLITGGSQGIGADIAKTLATNNYNVILNYNKSEEQAKKIQSELAEKNINIEIFKADVSNHMEVTKLINFCINKYHKIDVLINNAGISQTKLFTDISDLEWNHMIQTNLTSAFYTIKDTLPSMIHNKFGCIINISSIWGLVGSSCEVHYSVSKAGLDAMTKSLAKELGPSNIRVNSIAPGIINTNMNKNLSESDIQDITQEIPLGTIGNPQSITKCVQWLIEDDYTTGQIISVNGGWVIT